MNLNVWVIELQVNTFDCSLWKSPSLVKGPKAKQIIPINLCLLHFDNFAIRV